MRHKIIHHDAEKNYAIGDIDSEVSDPESESESKASDSSKFQTQAFSPAPQPNLKKFQTMKMDLMLAEIDTMLAKIWK